MLQGARAIAGPGRKEKRALLILSDGEDTASRTTLDEAVETVRSAGVPVYAIGIEMPDDPTVWVEPLWKRVSRGAASDAPRPSPLEALRRLTAGTGGWPFPIAAAKRCREVCIRVAEELRKEYVLGYSPANCAADGDAAGGPTHNAVGLLRAGALKPANDFLTADSVVASA